MCFFCLFSDSYLSFIPSICISLARTIITIVSCIAFASRTSLEYYITGYNEFLFSIFQKLDRGQANLPPERHHDPTRTLVQISSDALWGIRHALSATALLSLHLSTVEKKGRERGQGVLGHKNKQALEEMIQSNWLRKTNQPVNETIREGSSKKASILT